MIRLALALVLALLACDLPAPVFASHPAPIRKAVLRIRTDYTCSAVLVGPRTAVTAGHCVDLMEGLIGAVAQDADGAVVGRVSSAARAEFGDAGVLLLDRPARAWLELSDDPPDYGSPLTLAGYGCEHGVLGVRTASATGVTDWDGTTPIHGRVCRGDSGGAVLDTRGRLVGIMVSYNTKNKALSYVTPAAALRGLIGR